jgi:hypothetical protein
MLTGQEYERMKPVRLSVEMDQYGSWRIRDANQPRRWDIQRSFHGYREACLFRDSLLAYERGEVERAGQLHTWAVNGEAYYRR